MTNTTATKPAATPVVFDLTDNTELPGPKGGPGRTRNTEHDATATLLHDSGRVAKLTGNADDVALAVKGIRNAVHALYPGKTVKAVAEDGKMLVKVVTQIKRPRKVTEATDKANGQVPADVVPVAV